MIKILIKNRFYLMTLATVLICAVAFFVGEKIQSGNKLNYQVDFVSLHHGHQDVLELTRVESNQILFGKNDANKNSNIVESEKNRKINKKIAKQDSELPIKNLQSYISGFSSDLLMAVDLQEKFDTDEMDSALASEAEKDLAYVFYQGMEWQTFSPQEISCKANMCRVKLIISNEEENNKLMELISEEMQSEAIKYSFALPVNLPVEKIGYIYFVKSSLSGVLPGNK
jgi:hypothetical protein